MDWTSNTGGPGPEVGHTDGRGPDGTRTGMYAYWNSAHTASNCAAGTAGVGSGGGNGRIYCFATN